MMLNLSNGIYSLSFLSRVGVRYVHDYIANKHDVENYAILQGTDQSAILSAIDHFNGRVLFISRFYLLDYLKIIDALRTKDMIILLDLMDTSCTLPDIKFATLENTKDGIILSELKSL